MTEFYVSFEWLDLLYIAVVAAPARPTDSHFASYEEFHAAMDALGHDWQLKCETPHPYAYISNETRVWQLQQSSVEALVLARPIVKLPGGIVLG